MNPQERSLFATEPETLDVTRRQPTTFLLTDSELVELCQDPAWQILRFDRTPDGRYRIEAMPMTSTPADPAPATRTPYRDD